MIDLKTRNRLQKLRALAERGVGGEAENAKTMLDRLMKKHGLTDFESEVVSCYWFEAKTNHQQSLVRRCASVVLDLCPNDVQAWQKSKGAGKRSQIGFDLTQAQAAELDLMYDALKSAWEESVTELFTAFIVDNWIVSDAEEKAIYERLDKEGPSNEPKTENRFVGSVGKTEIRKRLTSGSSK